MLTLDLKEILTKANALSRRLSYRKPKTKTKNRILNNVYQIPNTEKLKH